MQHRDVLGVDLGLVEGDVLPVGNLGPDHDAVAIGCALHALVVRVVARRTKLAFSSLR